MNELSRKPKIEYFDPLRLLATFAVVLIHTQTPFWGDTEINSHQWQALNLYLAANRWSVPVFMMISGVLFLGSKRTLPEIFRKNILRLLTAFVFWSAIYTAICYAKGQYTPLEAVFAFVEGYYHMWYLPVIIGLYLVVPILRKIAESEPVTRYFLVAAFVMTSLLPTTVSLLNLQFPTAGRLLSKLSGQLQMTSVTGYSVYFLLGYYLHQKQIRPLWRKRIYLAGVVSFLVTILGGSALSVWKQAPVHILYEYPAPNIFCTSAAIFVFAKYHFRYGRASGLSIRILQALSKCTFGAYLIHPLVYDILRYNLGLEVMAIHPIVSIPVVGLGVFLLSMLLSAILNCIPILKHSIV